MTCYKYIFKYFTRSIGGFISFVLIIINIICIIFYFLFGLPKLKIYILSMMESYLSFLNKNKLGLNNAPPRKRSLKNEVIANKIEKSNKKVRINPSDVKKEGKGKKNAKRLNTGNDLIKKEKLKTPVGKPVLISTKLKSENQKDIIISLKESKENKSKLKLLDDTTKIQNKKENENQVQIFETKDDKFFEEYLATNPDDMELDDALVKDKRTFSECLIENLKEKQMIAFTFFSDDPVKIRIMRIMLFTLNINLYFVITGLFFSEEYITELYKIGGKKENFFSYIPRYIDKLIYTTLVSIIIGYIVELF